MKSVRFSEDDCIFYQHKMFWFLNVKTLTFHQNRLDMNLEMNKML